MTREDLTLIRKAALLSHTLSVATTLSNTIEDRQEAATHFNETLRAYSTKIHEAKQTWRRNPALGEAVAPFIAGNPSAWFVELVGLLKQAGDTARDFGLSRDWQDVDLTAGRKAIRGVVRAIEHYEQTLDIVIAAQGRDSDDEATVTRDDIAKIVCLEPSGMTRYTKEWSDPVVASSGRRRAQWSYRAIRQKLVEQFPDYDFPEQFPAGTKAAKKQP